MSTQRYNFIGIDGRGAGRTGDVHVSDLAAWVEKKYQQGWTKLTVLLVPERTIKDGRRVAVSGAEWPVVAKIERRGDDGIQWWAQS